MRCIAATASTIRGCTGSRSRSPTTTLRATPVSPASSTPRCMLGENFYGPRSLHAAIQAGAGDYVMPDLMRIGGVTGWLRAAAIAGAAGVQMSSHLYPEFASHLLRVAETGALAGVAGLGASDPGRAVRARGRPPPDPRRAGRRPGMGRGRDRALSQGLSAAHAGDRGRRGRDALPAGGGVRDPPCGVRR